MSSTRLLFCDLAFGSGCGLEIIRLNLSHHNIRLRLDVREHRLRINADPEDQEDQRRELPCLARVQVFQPLVGFVGDLAKEYSLIKPQHISRAEDDSYGSERAPRHLGFERAPD